MADKQEDSVNVVEARAKLAEKFGDQSRLGGKGTQRRKKKAVHKTQVTDDKKLKPIIKKFGVQPLPGIDEVNMFKDDNTVLNFKHPEGILITFWALAHCNFPFFFQSWPRCKPTPLSSWANQKPNVFYLFFSFEFFNFYFIPFASF